MSSNGNGPFVMLLEGALGLRDAVALSDRFKDALANNEAVTVDAGKLQEIDVSIVQLLIAAHKRAQALGRSFGLASAPDGVLRQALERCGVLSPTGACLTPEKSLWHGPQVREIPA